MGMHGPTCVSWANLTPFAPQAAEGEFLSVEDLPDGDSPEHSEPFGDPPPRSPDRDRSFSSSVPPFGGPGSLGM